MYVLIIIHGPLPDQNEYYGTFDSEVEAEEYVDKLMLEHDADIDDYSVQPLGSPSL